MNIENIEKLIDSLRAEKIATFNLGNWCVKTDSRAHTCGTVACIAGFAALLHKDYVFDGYMFVRENKLFSAYEVATEFLEIGDVRADELFTPDLNIDYSGVTPELAAKVLENLIDTGDVDWSVVGLNYVEESNEY